MTITKMVYKQHVTNNLHGREYYPKLSVNLCDYVYHKSAPWTHDMTPEEMSTAQKLVEQLLKIRGVIKLSVSPYELHIHKSPAYTWDEVHPQILQVFRDVFGLEEFEEIDLNAKTSEKSSEAKDLESEE